jgi:hypothetical protein
MPLHRCIFAPIVFCVLRFLNCASYRCCERRESGLLPAILKYPTLPFSSALLTRDEFRTSSLIAVLASIGGSLSPGIIDDLTIGTSFVFLSAFSLGAHKTLALVVATFQSAAAKRRIDTPRATSW